MVLRGAGQVNSYQNRWEFLNREKESTFGLNYIRLGARGYNPTRGQFMSIDPKADEGQQISFSPYTYGFNNPIRFSDPDGLMGEDCCGEGLGGVLLTNAKAQWEAGKSYGRSLLQKAENGLATVLSYTDFNDATVLVTTATRGGNGINLDGSKATTADKWAAAGGAALPIVSGSAVKKVVGGVADKIDDAIKSIDGYATGSHEALNAAQLKDSHHIIQDAAVRDLPNYNRKSAPAVQLEGPSTKIGTSHYYATQAQRQSGGGTYASERRIGYRALRAAGVSQETSKKLIRQADDYFKSIGVTPNTQTRIPGNRN